MSAAERPADNSAELTDGFHLVVDALKLNGLDTIFGVAGIPITDLLRLAKAEGIRYYGFRHEQSAANAAAIAGFLTQKPGICMTVSAPGFLNGLVGLANATINCFPMILISGSSDRAIVDLEQGDYEEMDQLSVARPHCKAAYRVNRPQDIGVGIARAIRAAVSGRPGGVYLDLTAEVLGAAAAARSYAIGNADAVPLAGARLNWLLSHGRAPLWNENTKFVQVDISPTEFDSNRSIAAPVAGDIKSVFAAFNAALKPGQIKRQGAWVDEIGKRKQQNIERMAARLNADPSPMNFSSALRAVRNALASEPDVYVVNEGANTLDFGRNIIDMNQPRHRLDSGTWSVMGIGMGYAIGAAAVTGKPVVAIEGASAFGFSGMEIETICRYELPVTTIIFNNNGVYRGDPADRPYSPTGLLRDARYEKIIEAFGGAGYHCEDTPSLTKAVSEALASGKPALINAVIDPTAGTESGHIQSLNPRSAVAQRPPS